jgi:hypothetical protein
MPYIGRQKNVWYNSFAQVVQVGTACQGVTAVDRELYGEPSYFAYQAVGKVGSRSYKLAAEFKESRELYRERYGVEPSIALVNHGECELLRAQAREMSITGRYYIQPGLFYFQLPLELL